MTEDQSQDALNNLKSRLDEARKQHKSVEGKDPSRGRAMGVAYRMGIELVLAVMIGTYLGYVLDGWLETKPFLMIVFFFLGIAAGIKNVFRAAEQMQSQTQKVDGNSTDPSNAKEKK